MDNCERISELRRRCLMRKANPQHQRLHERLTIAEAESLRDSAAIDSWQLRAGQRTAARLKAIDFQIDELELLAGRPDLAIAADTGELEKAVQTMKQYPGSPGQTGHCELDYGLILDKGLPGLLDYISEKQDRAQADTEKEAHESFRAALDGLKCMIENAERVVATQLVNCGCTQREAELKAIAESCQRLRSGKPETFRDALQLVWFVELAVMAGDRVGLVVPGHLDRWLWAFYQRDISNGSLAEGDALSLLEGLYILINEYIPDGLAMSVMVGGRDGDGSDVTNDLSYLCMEALRRTNLVYPTVGVCWHPGTPSRLVDLTTELISQGYTTPAFFGDETIQKGLRGYQVSAEEACWYINSTCVEITPSRSSNVWVASPYFNTCQILLDEIEAQVGHGDGVASFEQFLKAYFSRLGEHIERAVGEQNHNREQRRQFGRKPLQSVFTRDCLARGRDIDDGGAKYNWVECSFVGIANLADSLYVIRREVFEEKKTSFDELDKMLKNNFEDHRNEHQQLLNCYPKYGNNQEDVDDLVRQIRQFVVEQCRRYRMLPDDSFFIPGAFCWIMHERLGRESGATPDGRLAGFPFADGGGPAQGREKSGPTSAILSTTAWDHSDFIGGVAFNMKFTKNLFHTREDREKLKELILAYLRKGGFEVQINVVDHTVLEKAKANPDQYRDLVVRIGGYTDYFTRLSPEMQQEVMMRTEFSAI